MSSGALDTAATIAVSVGLSLMVVAAIAAARPRLARSDVDPYGCLLVLGLTLFLASFLGLALYGLVELVRVIL